MAAGQGNRSGRDDRVCVGQITASHGVRGLVRLRPFTQTPEGVTAYGPLSDEAGRRLDVTLKSLSRGQWLAAVKGVTTREAADALRGVMLYVDRRDLPPPEDDDEFYYADLIGLEVRMSSGACLGHVVSVDDHGAGDILEIALTPEQGGGTVALPFTRAVIPDVRLSDGFLVAEPPDGTFEPPPVPDSQDATADEPGSDRPGGERAGENSSGEMGR